MSKLHLEAKRVRSGITSAAGLVLLGCLAGSAASGAPQGLPEPLRQRFEAGVAAEKAGRLEDAEKCFQWVLRNGGEAAFVHNNLGIVYQRRRDHARAIAEFREAIRLEPDYVAPHALLGASLLAMDNLPDAIRELERAVKLDPKQPLTRVELAKAYARAYNLAAVVDQYRALRELSPHDPEYVYQAGQSYLKMAEWCLEQMKRIDSQSPRVSESLAEAYRAQGRITEAVRVYQRAAQADPRLPGIHLALAQIYFEQKKANEARREIELELAIVPESIAAKALQQRILSGQAGVLNQHAIP
jgi:tetratricopeptide (TPR) repeat protein